MAPKIIIRKSMVSEKGSKLSKPTFQSSLSTSDQLPATGAASESCISSSDLQPSESASVADQQTLAVADKWAIAQISIVSHYHYFVF